MRNNEAVSVFFIVKQCKTMKQCTPGTPKLSHTIDTIIGDRDIGLSIVDAYGIIGLNSKDSANKGFLKLKLHAFLLITGRMIMDALTLSCQTVFSAHLYSSASSKKMDPPVFELRLKRGKLDEDTATRIRCPALNVFAVAPQSTVTS